MYPGALCSAPSAAPIAFCQAKRPPDAFFFPPRTCHLSIDILDSSLSGAGALLVTLGFHPSVSRIVYRKADLRNGGSYMDFTPLEESGKKYFISLFLLHFVSYVVV